MIRGSPITDTSELARFTRTGLDAATFLAVALTLTAMGFMLRRLTFTDDR